MAVTKRKWLLGSYSGVLLAGTILGLSATSANADLLLDLKLLSNSGGTISADGKSATATANSTYTFGLYASVTGGGQLQNVSGSFITNSLNGGAVTSGSIVPAGDQGFTFNTNGTINPTPVTLVGVAPFNAAGSQTGASVRLNPDGTGPNLGDNIFDLGAPNGGNISDFVAIRSIDFQNATTPVLIGRISYTVPAGGLGTTGTTAFNFLPRKEADGSTSDFAALWKEGATVKTGTTGNITLGSSVVLSLGATTVEWKTNGNGNWGDANNWTGTPPNGAADVANFLQIPTVNSTVTLEAPKTVGTLNLDNNKMSYTLGAAGGTNSLTVNNAIAVTSGNHTINAPLVMGGNVTISGAGSLTTKNVTNGSILTVKNTITTGAISGTAAAGKYSGTLNVGDATTAGTVTADVVRQAALNIAPNSSVKIKSNGGDSGTSVLSALTFSGANHGSLDLTNNDLILFYSGASPLATVRQQIIDGLSGAGGITSSDPDYGSRTIFAPLDNANFGLTDWNGQSLGSDANQIILKYTYFGDANLDGMVTGDDYLVVDGGLGTTNASYANGDVNLDGIVNGDDYLVIDGAIGAGTGGAGNGPLAVLGITAVPEPATMSLLGVGALGLLARRRRA